MLGLGTAIDLPAPENLEGLAIHDEDAGRAIGAILAATAERGKVTMLYDTRLYVGRV